MTILARIHANGGEVVQREWRFALVRGRLSPDALAWVRAHWSDVCREVWPLFGDWMERAAIREFDGGMDRPEAERAAYAEVGGC